MLYWADRWKTERAREAEIIYDKGMGNKKEHALLLLS